MPKRSPKTAKTVSERLGPPRTAFYDASAIAKAYLVEAETADVRRWLGEGGVVVSRLTEVEVPSAIARRVRDGHVSESDRHAATQAFLDDMELWDVIELTSEVARRAVALLSVHPIRAGDAIQLASAVLARESSRSIVSRFVGYDAQLLAAARLEGFVVHEYRRR